ncbi:MAG: hypothetical protein QMD71_05260 [bacterium]|nr:hypothetical protein [bacterium]
MQFLKSYPIIGAKSFKKVIVVLLIGLLIYLFSRGIIENDVRLLFITTLIFILGASCLRLYTGVISILLYLPFMAFIRRYIYQFNPYIGLDPILIVYDAFVLFMLSYFLIFENTKLYSYFKKSKLVRCVTLLLFLFIFQIFNPIQGNIFVGLGGIKFHIIPLLFFYFGLFFQNGREETIWRIILIVGTLVAIYGIYQVYFGFTGFEEYWIQHGGYVALKIGEHMRPFSTFSNNQEYSLYLLISGIFAIGYMFIKKPFNLFMLAPFGTMFFALLVIAARGSVFAILFGIALFFALGTKNFQKTVVLSLICIVIYVVIAWATSVPCIIEGPVPVGKIKTLLAHLFAGIFDPFGKGSTLLAHLIQYVYALQFAFFSNPFGTGLGAATLATMKFGGTVDIEGYIPALIMSSGLLSITLFILIIYYTIKIAFYLYRKKGDPVYRAIVSIMVITFIAGDLTLYSVGPIIWFIIGWVAKESLSQQEDKNKKMMNGE